MMVVREGLRRLPEHPRRWMYRQALQAACAAVERRNRGVPVEEALERCLIVSGVPRGGTTWVAELLLRTPGTALIWEPLYPSKATPWTNWRQVIPEDVDWPAAESYFRQLLSGHRVRPDYIVQGLPPLFNVRFQLVKFCRANRLLPWLVRHLRVRPPVLVVRHPCAVVASQLRYGNWHDIGPPYPVPRRPYEDYYEQFRGILERLETPVQILAARWCLDHKLVLEHPNNDDAWITVPYEALLSDGRAVLERVFHRLGLPVPLAAYRGLPRPSATTQEGSPILSRGDQLAGWKQHLSGEEVEEILAVVDAFGLTRFYSDDLEPDYRALRGAS